jgi:hypothetical protein
MRRIIVALAVVAGAIVFLNLSQVGSAVADEVACMACKAQAQGACLGSSGDGRTTAWELRCISEYIAEKCIDACQKKSDKDD